MMLDCAVIGGGPAGLNASLVLGRSRRATVLFDNEQPRNAVTQEAHGFMTRDGINPGELRRLAREELGKYPDVHIKKQKVTRVWKHDGIFSMETEEGDLYTAKKVIVATGLKERLPEIPHIHQFYGTSLFSCPFCDGWELRDRPLAVIAENSGALHMTKVVYNWSRDLVVCTNGKQTLSGEEKRLLEEKGVTVYEQPIAALTGDQGDLKQISFNDGTTISRDGGFVITELEQAASIGEGLGCEFNNQGAIKTDGIGRTSVDGVFACGDASIIAPSQLIIAAAEGSKAAIGVNAALVEENF
ncbi:Thioredoxin reductase [Halobacillus dabanensis]|uniref:Thioredoxin reductase n=1 Tax=Halobacillus dabanensis TaxID=240302 RepID=A0A1I3UYK8_HALDA|nr:NAD(P)/FAD-dependent oxidoreductase [Halobacillus dabanensis]SFJ87843.1 Thioredoxin reductase [Halobacillus dabanensis]